MLSNCKKCKKEPHCCIFKNNGFAFVGIQDAQKIKNRIKKDYNYFLDYSPLPKRVIHQLRYEDPALEGKLRYSQLLEGSLPRLRTKKNKRCIFLDDYGKCEIYSIRPNICRIFPFWAMKLTNGRIKVIVHDDDPKCRIIECIADKDVENTLSKKEISAIKSVFRKICKENLFYRKDIRKFAKIL